MYEKRSQFEHDVARTIHALKHGINCAASSPDRIITLLGYATNRSEHEKEK
jgi:hypothetical protein